MPLLYVISSDQEVIFYIIYLPSFFFFSFVLPVDLTGNIPFVSAESGQAAMEAWNSASRSDNILESYVIPRQIVACSGPRLRPKCQTEGNRTGCCHTLQWKHEALAWNWHAQISKLLGKIRQLWSSLFAGLQHQSLMSKWYCKSFDFVSAKDMAHINVFYCRPLFKQLYRGTAGIDCFNYDSFCNCFPVRAFSF